MKKRLSLCFLVLLVFVTSLALSTAAFASDWATQNSKYTFYVYSPENASKTSIRRIDSSGKEKVMYSGGIFNILGSSETYLYFTIETPESKFKSISHDVEMEYTMYGPMHIDIMRMNVSSGKVETLKSNIPAQIPVFSSSGILYSTYPSSTSTKYIKKISLAAKSLKVSNNDALQYAGKLLPNANTMVYNNEDSAKITTPNGSSKTIKSDYLPTVTDKYLIAQVGADYYRYDLNGANGKKIGTAGSESESIYDMEYCNNYLYFITDTDGNEVPDTIKKMSMSGKVSTVKNVGSITNKLEDRTWFTLNVTDSWIFIYDEMYVEGEGYWANYIGRLKRS